MAANLASSGASSLTSSLDTNNNNVEPNNDNTDTAIKPAVKRELVITKDIANNPLLNTILKENKKQYIKIVNQYQKVNASTADALTILNPTTTPFHGREKELELLENIINRPLTPVALLLGEAGVGKTAMIKQHAHTHPYQLVVNMNIGRLSALGSQQMRKILTTILDQLYQLELVLRQYDANCRVILFIDEIHTVVTVFGAGTKIGGDVLKETFAQPPIGIIVATTRREYDSTIAVDKPLAERFKQVELQDLTSEQVAGIAVERWGQFSNIPLDNDVLSLVLRANAAYRSDSAEPRKTIDILEDLAAYAKTTGLPPTVDQVEQVFKDRYRINLHFSVNPDDVYETIARRVKGQPAALHVLKRLIRSLTYKVDTSSNRPLVSALLTGPTGVGKTETVKSIADTIYPGENVIRYLNMTDYQTAEREPVFRKLLGEYVKHTPNAIVLFDELEKSHVSVRDSLLQILDEGIVNYETVTRENLIETNHTSLRNTMIFATTNAGHEVFSNDARYSLRGETDDIDGDVDASGVDQLLKSLYPFLESAGFRPEMLGRFDRILPYRGLSAGTLLSITEGLVSGMLDYFLVEHGKRIVLMEPRQWPRNEYDYVTSDVALFITFVKSKANDPKSGGARDIKRNVQEFVYDAVVDALIDYPGVSRFRIGVSGDSPIYSAGALYSEGRIVVEPDF